MSVYRSLETCCLIGARKRNLSQQAHKLPKIPNHLAVLWVPINYHLNTILSPTLIALSFIDHNKKIQLQSKNQLNSIFHDVLKLLSWAQDIGIHEITLYDERGLLKSHQLELLEYLSNSSFINHRTQISSIQENLMGPSAQVSYEIKQCGTFKSLRLNLIDQAQGHQHLAKVAQEFLCMIDGKDSIIKRESLDVKTIDEKICSTSIQPPDLLMVLGGRSLRLRGFPPWQLSVTEIYHARSYAIFPFQISYREFSEALKLFGDCEQRGGS
ncbi:hypothetical protein O181_034553 [Austropuccinia psidii MF-1]|uniref:ditrans,polycis-polyprenyl diphosphate synthase [(2E,6E)-farnesyldiphosphate specific] n=1 Tax=Austropuccinia psidii MF-1 TaxID=1389203 RepID=A0A9Q3D3P9_9BASI|nr:hypothetical protein [Austropuccinia psidii MF-1]